MVVFLGDEFGKTTATNFIHCHSKATNTLRQSRMRLYHTDRKQFDIFVYRVPFH